MKHFVIASHIDREKDTTKAGVLGYRVISVPSMEVRDITYAGMLKALKSGIEFENIRLSKGRSKIEFIGNGRNHYPSFYNGVPAGRNSQVAMERYVCIGKENGIGVLVDCNGTVAIREIFKEPLVELSFQLSNVKYIGISCGRHERGGVLKNVVNIPEQNYTVCRTQLECGIVLNSWRETTYNEHMEVLVLTGKKLLTAEECGLANKIQSIKHDSKDFNNRVKLMAMDVPQLKKDGLIGDGNNTIDYKNDTLMIRPPATGVASKAFLYNSNIKKLYIMDGIKSIGESAFCGCDKLTEVKLADSITMIGKRAFYYGVGDFNPGKTVVRLPNNKELVVEEEAFMGSGIDRLIIPEKVALANIGAKAFERAKLRGVLIENPGESVIKERVFACEYGLRVFANKGKLVEVRAGALSYCVHLAAIDLRWVRRIGDYAFQGCSSLSNIELNNVKRIGSKAFKGCKNMVQMIIRSEEIEEIGDGAFESANCCIICKHKAVYDRVQAWLDRNYGYQERIKYTLKAIYNPEI